MCYAEWVEVPRLPINDDNYITVLRHGGAVLSLLTHRFVVQISWWFSCAAPCDCTGLTLASKDGQFRLICDSKSAVGVCLSVSMCWTGGLSWTYPASQPDEVRVGCRGPKLRK